MPPIPLLIIFSVVAFIYASVGLGGGSAYAALLLLWSVPYDMIPTTSLALNLVVTTLAAGTFLRSGQLRAKRVWPYLVLSIPAAYLGGSLVLPRETFLWLLMLALIVVAARIYLWQTPEESSRPESPRRVPIALALGAVLGLLAGTVGIGGGIFLVPAIILLGLGSQKEAVAAGSVFVWLNSLAGLVPRLGRGAVDVDLILYLAVVVAIGGIAGAYFSAYRWNSVTIQRVLGLVVLAAVFSIGNQLI